MNYIYGHDDIVASFVAQLIPSCRERGFGKAKAIGVIDKAGRLIAGFVYHGYDPDAGTIQISGASLPGTKWCNQQTLAHVYRYPFLQLGCQMIIQMVPADDERLLYQLSRLNYQFIPLPRMFGRHKDAVLAQLTFEDWAANRLCRRYGHHLEQTPLEEAA